MKKITIISATTLLLLLMVSCAGKPKRPSFMPDDKVMADLFFEMHLTQAMIRYGHIDKKYEKTYYASILRRHNLTAEQYDSCLIWLAKEKDIYKKLYEDAEVKANQLRARTTDAQWQHDSRDPYWKDLTQPEIDDNYRVVITNPESSLMIKRILPAELSTDNSCRYPNVE